MMINIFVDIKWIKHIQNRNVSNSSRKSSIRLANQMGCTNHCVKVDYCIQRVPFTIKVRLNPPHPSINIWLHINFKWPVHKSTQVNFCMVPEWKNGLDSCNVKPSHTGDIRISNSEGGIVVRDLELPPCQCCVYVLPSHTVGTADITQSMIDCYSGGADTDIGVKVQNFSWL